MGETKSGFIARAGSVANTDFPTELCTCLANKSLIKAGLMQCDSNGAPPYLELYLDFTPGGVRLGPSQEKIVTFHFDVE